MPLLFGPLLGLLVGMSLAWASRESLPPQPEAVSLVRAPWTLVTVELALFVHAPVLVYFAAAYGDWSWLYLVAASRVPSAIDLVLVVLGAASVPAGFWLAMRAAAERRPERFAKVAIAPALALLVAVGASARRLMTAATYAQYHGDFGTAAIGKSPLGRALLVSWVVLVAGAVWAGFRIRAARRRR